MQSTNRRQFLKTAAVTATAASVLPFSKSSYAQSANDKVVVGVAGIRSRGKSLAQKFAVLDNVEVKTVIDVDSRYLDDAVKAVQEKQAKEPKACIDFRKALDDKDLDALVIATPDHWHAPMAIQALQAGKHVYVEKPHAHNPREGEWLVQAWRKSGKQVQVGTQRRSMNKVDKMIGAIRDGIIGDVYMAKCFYCRKRLPIGFGNEVAVPDYLNWDLWQGPAPRVPYRDNVHPYNWHWFWHWGTGEALNNGTHMLDIARWALDVQYPIRVSSFGGRWHYRNVDDWECPDTQEIMIEYDDGVLVTWGGRSTNQFDATYRHTDVLFFGTKGILDYDGNSDYKIFDLDNNLVYNTREQEGKVDAGDTVDPGLNDRHAENFVQSIRGLETLNAPADEVHKSVLLGLLGNISLRVGRTLDINKRNGHILNDQEAMSLWQRLYEPGWKPEV
ncbi:twin-arginine translocation signal domain-containing protein [candidate division KSB1 bacterium]|nr:twin-arginine translocation signal domain-containing protein [candidate division KSB1 bacterium]